MQAKSQYIKIFREFADKKQDYLPQNGQCLYYLKTEPELLGLGCD